MSRLALMCTFVTENHWQGFVLSLILQVKCVSKDHLLKFVVHVPFLKNPS